MKFLRRLSSVLLTAALAFGTAAPSLSASLPPFSEERVTVLVGTVPGADAEDILEGIPGASLLCTYSLIDAFAAEIPADKQTTLAASPAVTDVSLSATFLAPLAESGGGMDPDVIVSADTVLRSDDDLAGEGTLIAVLDSGFDVTHPVFTLPEGADTVLTKEDLPEAAKGTTAWRLADKSSDNLYVNEKIPLAFDYFDGDTDVSGLSVHGTHVAATAAGSDAGKGKLNGTAPGAQMLLMKVFDDTGENCPEYALITAIEDAVQLGADIINLSLGSLSYSGTEYSMKQTMLALQAAEKSGVLIVCAAGNSGIAGALGLASDLPRASDPDYGLPSEPAVLEGALAAASSANKVEYCDYIECAGNFIFYDETREVSLGQSDAFSEMLRGKSMRLCVIDGIGAPEDYEGIDVSGCIVLVRRGIITFAEKAQNAADAGASAVIVCDAESDAPFIMSTSGESPLPIISVSHRDGDILSRLDGTTVNVSRTAEAFASSESGISSFSSWGPTSDLLLTPDITAVGSSVIAAVPGGEYSVLYGTSMAAPQIAGMAARILSEARTWSDMPAKEERASLWKEYMMSAAEPMTAQNGLPLSPRAQGAGTLTQTHASILMQNTGDTTAINIGDEAENGCSFTIKLTNLTDSGQQRILRVPLITDEAQQGEDGIWYITGSSEKVPSTFTVSGDGVSAKAGTMYVTLEPHQETELTISIRPQTEYVEEKFEIFENGFYLEGFVALTDENGRHEASLPYLAFAGDWSDAPMIDETDWDDAVSFYGVNHLVTDPDAEEVLGDSPQGVLSSLFAFSPNRDGSADLIYFNNAPLRNIAEMHIEILDEDGNVLYTSAEFDLLKALATDGNLLYNTVRLWDGSDGINDHFRWEDGHYTVQLTLVGYTGGGQLLYIPIRIDTEKPVRSELKEEDGVLYASFTDNHALKQLRIYLPGEDGEYVLDESVLADNTDSAEISAVLPQDAAYVYVSAEDYAGNKNILRYWIDN